MGINVVKVINALQHIGKNNITGPCRVKADFQ
jgi:hypothetical protein